MSPIKKSDKVKKVNIHYLKNSGYRQIHADGAIGGVTTRKLININFYAERTVIPKSTQYNVTEEGKLGEICSKESKDGIIREIEFGVYLDLDTAKRIKSWLDISIHNLEESNKK